MTCNELLRKQLSRLVAPFSEGRLRFLEGVLASSVEVPGEDSGFTSEKISTKNAYGSAIHHKQEGSDA